MKIFFFFFFFFGFSGDSGSPWSSFPKTGPMSNNSNIHMPKVNRGLKYVHRFIAQVSYILLHALD